MMMRLFSLLASCFFFSGSSGNFCLLSIYCVAVFREKVWNTQFMKTYKRIQHVKVRTTIHVTWYHLPSHHIVSPMNDEYPTTVLRQSCEFQVLMFRIKFAGTGTNCNAERFVVYYCRIDLTTIFNDILYYSQTTNGTTGTGSYMPCGQNINELISLYLFY